MSHLSVHCSITFKMLLLKCTPESQRRVLDVHAGLRMSGTHPLPGADPGPLRDTVPGASCCCSVTQSCLTLCDPMDCSMPGFPVLCHLLELLKLVCIESVMPSNHLIVYFLLLLLPSVFPSIRVLSSDSVLCIRCPKDWRFSFSINLSNEYSGPISCRID